MTAGPTRPRPHRRDDRLEFRIPSATKALLAEAAAQAGLSLSEFCLRAAVAAAEGQLAEGQAMQPEEAEGAAS